MNADRRGRRSSLGPGGRRHVFFTGPGIGDVAARGPAVVAELVDAQAAGRVAAAVDAVGGHRDARRLGHHVVDAPQTLVLDPLAADHRDRLRDVLERLLALADTGRRARIAAGAIGTAGPPGLGCHGHRAQGQGGLDLPAAPEIDAHPASHLAEVGARLAIVGEVAGGGLKISRRKTSWARSAASPSWPSRKRSQDCSQP